MTEKFDVNKTLQSSEKKNRTKNKFGLILKLEASTFKMHSLFYSKVFLSSRWVNKNIFLLENSINSHEMFGKRFP